MVVEISVVSHPQQHPLLLFGRLLVTVPSDASAAEVVAGLCDSGELLPAAMAVQRRQLVLVPKASGVALRDHELVTAVVTATACREFALAALDDGGDVVVVDDEGLDGGQCGWAPMTAFPLEPQSERGFYYSPTAAGVAAARRQQRRLEEQSAVLLAARAQQALAAAHAAAPRVSDAFFGDDVESVVSDRAQQRHLRGGASSATAPPLLRMFRGATPLVAQSPPPQQQRRSSMSPSPSRPSFAAAAAALSAYERHASVPLEPPPSVFERLTSSPPRRQPSLRRVDSATNRRWL